MLLITKAKSTKTPMGATTYHFSEIAYSREQKKRWRLLGSGKPREATLEFFYPNWPKNA